ncbi:MAG: hypothetical protein QXU98_03065 [Candidatus Parvarchaeota archaeon]
MDNTNLKSRLKFKYYIPVIVIIAVIVITSCYYYFNYNGVSTLDCNNQGHCTVSILTGVFDGYTETINATLYTQLGSNVVTNIGVTAGILIAFVTILALFNREKEIVPLLAVMLIAQLIFFPVYWFYIKPVLFHSNTFGGGLSLWSTFCLLSIVLTTAKYSYNRYGAEKLIGGHLSFIKNFVLPSMVITLGFYEILISPTKQILAVAGITVGLMLVFLLLFVSACKKQHPNYKKENVSEIFRVPFFSLIVSSSILAFLLGVYLLPGVFLIAIIRTKNIVYALNPHVLGLIIYIPLLLVFKGHFRK